MAFPYHYISCPCTDITSSSFAFERVSSDAEREQEEKTLDPRNPRASYNLCPLDHLLWCEDCHEIRCPRCTVEEIVCWWCPSCLFEVPTTTVKSEGIRCNRSCFNCPICTAPLAIGSADHSLNGPFILACEYCLWSSAEIGLEFPKHTNLYAAFQKMRAQHSGLKVSSGLRSPAIEQPSKRSLERLVPSREEEELIVKGPFPQESDPAAQFAVLRSFYASQLSSTNDSNPLMSPSGQFNYDSPSSLARIMSIYTGQGSYGKKSSGKQMVMRESLDSSEGLHPVNPAQEEATLAKLRTVGWAETTSTSQNSAQISPQRFTSSLLPTSTLIRSKRSTRCRTCRHILVKPDSNATSTKYKIKLVAIHHIPTVSLKPFPSTTPQSSPPETLNLSALPHSTTLQFLLTLTNPLFDPLSVTLATPTYTPGRFAHRVTILCPTFTVGADTDVWDEALSKDNNEARDEAKRRQQLAEGLLVPEAGKIWEKGRNWTRVVLEVKCRRIEAGEGEEGLGEEDEDVLEIPVFVRLEWEADVQVGGGGGKEKREVAYWTVLGVGRVGS